MLDASQDNWFLKFLLILLSYGSVLLSGYFLIRFVQLRCRVNDLKFRSNIILRFLRNLAVGRLPYEQIPLHEVKERNNRSLEDQQTRKWGVSDCFVLFLSFAGIESALICMGYFQERIITQKYFRSNLESDLSLLSDHFEDAQFLVLANRLVALLLSGFYILFTWKLQPFHAPPFYLHSFSSLSNIIASWCQYEALKFISFPIQSVCKASKIIPTMIMGKILRRQRYNLSEYVLAITLVVGASLFFLSVSQESSNRSVLNHSSNNSHFLTPQGNIILNVTEIISPYLTTLSGIVLMIGYLTFDSFTPNWQKKLMDKSVKIGTAQMMFAVNCFSVLFCIVSVVQQWTFISSLNFILTHDRIYIDCLLLSLGSACGQRFGPVVLSVIMTLRQIFSILLSSFSFNHPLTVYGIFGLVLVFGAIFIDTYRKYKSNSRKS